MFVDGDMHTPFQEDFMIPIDLPAGDYFILLHADSPDFIEGIG